MAIITYDTEAGALYVSLGDGGIDKTVELDESVRVDYGYHGQVIGIEVLGVDDYKLEAE